MDVIALLRQRTLLTIAAYQVSGEYALIKFAATSGAAAEARVVRESLGAFKRARRAGPRHLSGRSPSVLVC